MTDLQLPRTRPKVAAVEPPPVVVVEPAPEPDPEPVEIKLTVRTLRGTSAGADVMTLVQPPPAGKRRAVRGQPGSPARVEPPQLPPASIGNQARPASAPSRVAGPVG